MQAIDGATSYWVGAEEFTGSNSFYMTVLLKEPIKPEKLYPAYRRCIMDNPILQSKLVDTPGQKQMEWSTYTPEELEQLLKDEELQCDRQSVFEELFNRYDPTNRRLMFTVSQVDSHTLIFKVNHALLNGQATLYWVDKWFGYYGDEFETNQMSRSSGSVHPLKYLKACLAAIRYLVGYKKATKSGFQLHSVDLSQGRTPTKQARGRSKIYKFSKAHTEQIIRVAKESRMTISEYLHGIISKGFLDHAPDKERICSIGVTDLHDFINVQPGTCPGNVTANLPMQFYKDRDLREQVKNAYAWFAKGTGFGINTVVGSLMGNWTKRKATFAKQCVPPLADRDAMTAQFIFSNLGLVKQSKIKEYAQRISVSVKAQAIYIGIMSIHGAMTFEVSYTEDLFGPEVHELTDRILAYENLVSPRW